MDSAINERVKLAALADKTSPYYKGLVELCRRSQAEEARRKLTRPAVTVPFRLEDGDVEWLERVFSITLRCRGNVPRSQSTPLVAAINFCLEAALVEHAGGAGRVVLCVDGDLMTVVMEGGGTRIVERTNATARLQAGYFQEDEAVKTRCSSEKAKTLPMAEIVAAELRAGGGEHWWPFVRSNGPEVDAVLVNHMKTPAGPHQVAHLAMLRGGAVALGALPFQVSFLYEDSGDLECFPGRYYVDKVQDVITFVPTEDATMSFSHPFSSLMEFVTLNSVTVEDTEFLCEKYKSLPGIIYYSLRRVGSDFEAPEVLRSCYFDASVVDRTVLKFPRVKHSEGGVPIGWERGTVTMETSRYEKVMHRLVSSTSKVVTPAEAYVVLTDYNNTVLNSLDTAVLASRMSNKEMEDAALAVSLQVNWRRSEARGTFNALSEVIGRRRQAANVSLLGLARVALVAWWSSPHLVAGCPEEELPESQVMDWFGNDYSVLAMDVDPWIEVQSVAGLRDGEFGRLYSWLPRPSFVSRKNSWYVDLLGRARKAIGASVGGCVKVPSRGVRAVRKGLMPVSSSSSSASSVTAVSTSLCVVERPAVNLTVVKQALRDKLAAEQGVVHERVPASVRELFDARPSPLRMHVPVPTVDVVSSFNSDLLMLMGDLPDRNVAATGYRLAETDVTKYAEAQMQINDAKRVIPKERWMRMPMVDAGVEGIRVQSQAALMGATFKRNVGVPANRGVVDLDKLPELAVQRFVDVCFVDDWQEIVEKHLNAGMWEPNMDDLCDFVGDLDEKKVSKMLKEFFSESMADLSSWQMMAKGKIKPSRERGADRKVDHSQTILYQENSSVNAMYSPIMRRVKKCVDECMRPNISLNAQESDEEHEAWYNSLNDLRDSYARTYSYAADIRCYDRSQEHAGLRCFLRLCKVLGLNEERLAKWESAYGPKRAACGFLGLVLVIMLSGISGSWDTLFRNGVINLITLIYATELDRKDIVMLDIKGDDLDAEFAKKVDVTTVVERMSIVMNMSAKFFTNDVRYMCKQFRLKLGGIWHFVSDPWVKTQAVCTPLVVDSYDASLNERWVSLVSSLRHYDNGLLVDAVAEAAQQHYDSERPLYGMARALSALRGSSSKFHAFYKAPVKVW